MSIPLYSKIANITYSIATLIFFIVIIIASSKLGGSDYHYMYNLGLNWNRGPLVSVDPSGDQCSATQPPIITNFWPGTSDGCYCRINTSLTHGPLRRGKCNKHRDNLLFCYNILKKSPLRWQNWRGKFLCGKRVDSSYLDLTISKRPESCPMNTRSCGIIDSLNNVMCVPSSTACPINSIQIDTSKNPTIPKDSTVIDADEAKIIFSNTNLKGKIVNELYVGDEQPCANPQYANYNYKPYILDKYYDKNKCTSKMGTSFYDERYQKIDKTDSETLFKDNGILNVLKALPLYKSEDYSHDMNLYKRGYIGLDQKCLADIKYSGVGKNILNDLTQIKNKVGTAIILSLWVLVFGIVLFIFMLIYIVMICLMHNNDEVSNIHKFSVYMMIIPMILEFIVLIMSFVICGSLKSYSNDHEVMQKSECVDELTFAAASNFYPNVATGKNLSIFNIFLAFVLLNCKVVQIFICCGEDEREGFSNLPETNTEMAPPQNNQN
jgi:hypothetical protein